MLQRLGLAATVVYAAPVLLQLSEARASSFSGPSSSDPRRRRRRGAVASKPSFSDVRNRGQVQGVEARPRRRVVASSFSR
jgi:hypothetical protein